MTRSYTARDLLASVDYDADGAGGNAPTSVATLTYDAGGRETQRTFGDGLVTTRTYRLDNLTETIDTPGVTSFSYSYDANKNRTAETIGGVMAGYSTSTVSYDEIDRLVQYAQSRGFQRSWQLSPVGDWNRVTTDGTDQLRTHGPMHEILSVDGSALEHNAKGNVTFIPVQARASGSSLRLLWGFDNELRGVDADGDGVYETTYRYDALQRRVAKTTDGNTTVTVFDLMQELGEYRSGDPAASPQSVWIYATYVDEPLLVRRGDGSEYYFHQNSQ